MRSKRPARARGERRQSALWGSGNRGGESRSSALWGKRGRGAAALLTLTAALAFPVAGIANGANPQQPTFVPASLVADAQANPGQVFHVIIQGRQNVETDALVNQVSARLQQLQADVAGKLQQAQQTFAQAQNDATANDQNANAAQSAAQQLQLKIKGLGGKGNGLVGQLQGFLQKVQDFRAKAAAAQQAAQAAQTDVSQFQNRLNWSSRTANWRYKYHALTAGAVDLTGQQITDLATSNQALAITPDTPTKSAGYQNAEMWRQTTAITSLWSHPAVTCALDPLTLLQLDPTCSPLAAYIAPQAPAIAIVDSGIDPTKSDFAGRIAASVNVSSLAPGATGDQEGHGTMVAGIAAGLSATYPGVAQNAPLVDVRTADGQGESLTSDVIAGIDWIIQNKAAYNIRVANFSMAGNVRTSFTFDPLDRAVEKLWFNGIVVVAAAGNYGTAGSAVDMSYAPGNDPFIITVGAVDQNQTASTADDTIAPWSAYGHTGDGFAKPELSAPGRYLIMPYPAGSYISTMVPDRIVSPGYMWMSGTSFAAPVVAGAAAQILALHPSWTPDQVKGALMYTAQYLPNAGFAAGVGEVNGAAAAAMVSPPNPNENLDPFVTTDPSTGQAAFDAASWSSAVASNANWSSANWSSANWSSANWSSANWSSANWAEASWAE